MQHMDGRMDGVGMFTNIKLLQKYQPSAASNPHLWSLSHQTCEFICWNKYTFCSSRTAVWHDCVLLTDNWFPQGQHKVCSRPVKQRKTWTFTTFHSGPWVWTVHNAHRSAWGTFYICNLSWQQVIKRIRRSRIDQQLARRCFLSSSVWYALHRRAIICQPLLLG